MKILDFRLAAVDKRTSVFCQLRGDLCKVFSVLALTSGCL